MELDPLPYYKWHWLRYRASRKVQRMSVLERGIYRELLDEQWAKGCITDDRDSLAELLDDSEQVLVAAKQVLSKCFTEIQPGFWQNETLEEQRTEKDTIRSKRKMAGSLGGKAKLISEANAKQTQANASKCHIEREKREREEGESRTPFVRLGLSLSKSDGEPPDGLTELEYARWFWDQEMQVPFSDKELTIAGQGIRHVSIGEQCSLWEAAKRVAGRGHEWKRKNPDKPINRFWFQDGRHKTPLEPIKPNELTPSERMALDVENELKRQAAIAGSKK